MKDQGRPWILGIGSSPHNGGVCLLHGDEIVVAIQEERLLRVKRAKYAAGLSSLAIPYCLEYAGITPAELSAVGVCAFGQDAVDDDVHLNRQLRTVANGIPVVHLTHHLAHAAAAFATSGFREAAILIVDGNGAPWHTLARDEMHTVVEPQRRRYDAADPTVVEVLSMYDASEAGVRPIEKHLGQRPRGWTGPGMPPFFSLGRLFENVGMQIFGERLDGPGKVMGLAAYGRPSHPPEAFFDFAGDEIVFRDELQQQFRHDDRWPERSEEYTNLAASVQAALERALLWYLARLRARSASASLCYAGGVALNSVANEQMIRNGGFENVFIMPAAEDSGTAIGAAYHALWHLRQQCRPSRRIHDAVGRRYTDADIETAIAAQPGCRAERSSRVVEQAAQSICEGRILGWFQGRSELGPRALGQRSIIADPRRPDMKDLLNSRVKFREGSRPYAPVVLLEHAATWFETTPELAESPYMLRVMNFRPEYRDRVPAVVHADGTGRVQTVTADENGRLHALVSAFYRQTGVPILLNTSFNTSGSPIVETPEDALWCFLFSGIDLCVLGDYLVSRSPEWSVLDWCPYARIQSISQEYAAGNERVDWQLRPSARKLFRSVPEGSLDQLNAYARRECSDHIRIWTEHRWGRVIHLASTDLLPVLQRMTGRRSAREILAEITEDGLAYSETAFIRLLGTLAQRSIIGLRPSPVTARPDHVSVVDERSAWAPAQA
jgi:carbamoyltransferase